MTEKKAKSSNFGKNLRWKSLKQKDCVVPSDKQDIPLLDLPPALPAQIKQGIPTTASKLDPEINTVGDIA